jgi:serine/threonine-protein kinase
METGRDLLFGLMAFQQGAIDADRLAETLAECAVDETVSFPDRMVDQGWMTVEQKTELHEAVEKELRAHGGDAQATLQATVDARFLEAVQKVPQLDAAPVGHQTQTFAPTSPVLLEALGEETDSRERYTLSLLYAKGGMGQVWLAHDPALGREIALKELRPDQRDNSNVTARFLSEAKIAAQLEHPGIVPVYELGEGELPYYTMRFVRGGTLSQAVRQYHKSRRAGESDPVMLVSLLGNFVAVCHAIAYAHSRGVIHRDLKGQNVVLGDFGEVVVLDWGLAKRVDAAAGPKTASAPAEYETVNGKAETSAEDTLTPEPNPGSSSAPSFRPVLDSRSADEQTIQGQVLGTPAYMAPEQAEGRQDKTDHRTDVYGLGAMLYEILTGQPPFHARSAVELLRRVRHDAPIPPRLVNPETSAALQAICLKALAKAPGDRYASAGDLARDVQRYLADEPVEAYPEPWTVRAARWARKHRTLVSTAAALLVMSTVALSIGTALVVRERDEATAQGAQARRAVNEMYTQVAANWLEDQLDPLQKEYLEKALTYYEKFVGHAANDPAARLEHGLDYQRIGDIHRKLGRFAESERAFGRAFQILAPLAAAAPDDLNVRRALALTETRAGDLYFRENQIEKAEPLYKQAVRRLEPIAGGALASDGDRAMLARSLRSQAELLRRKGLFASARPVSVHACELLEQVMKASPKTPEARYELAQAYDVLGRVTRELGLTTEYDRACRRAFELLDPLIAEVPTVPRYREAMFHACNGLGGLEHESGRLDQAESHWRRMLKEAERLSQDFPGRPEYVRYLAGACSNVGGILAEQDRFDDAEPLLQRGITLNEELRSRSPDDLEISFDLGNCYHNLGYLQLRRGRAGDALETLARAEKLERMLLEKTPGAPRSRRNLALVLRWRGEALEQLGRPGARESYSECVTRLDRLASEFPDNLLYQLDLARCLNRLGTLVSRAGQPDEAEQFLDRALAALDSERITDWSDERFREKAATLSNQGSIRQESKRPNAEEPLRASIEISTRLANRPNASLKDREYLAIAQNNLGELFRDQKRPADAEPLFQKSLDHLKRIVAENPKAAEDRFYVGYVGEQLGKTLLTLDRPADARLALEQAVAAQKEAIQLTGGKRLDYKALLASHLSALADACLRLDDHEAVMRTASELARAATDPGQGSLEAARILARCAGRIQADTRLDQARREDLGRKCLGRTVVMLREAVDVSPKLADSVKNDEAFKALLSRPEFQAMLNTLVDLTPSKTR